MAVPGIDATTRAAEMLLLPPIHSAALALPRVLERCTSAAAVVANSWTHWMHCLLHMHVQQTQYTYVYCGMQHCSMFHPKPEGFAPTCELVSHTWDEPH